MHDNYYTDSRVIAGARGADRDESFDRQAMTLSYTLEDEEGYEIALTIPAKYEVCETCGGKGSHVSPSIDCNGITGDEWAEWDPEERESYMRGGYDVPCYDCGGERVVPVIDESRARKDDIALVHDHLAAKAQERREDAYCARMGF